MLGNFSDFLSSDFFKTLFRKDTTVLNTLDQDQNVTGK